MGLFLEDKTPEPKQEPQVIKQDWLAVLIDKSFAFITLVTVGLATLYWHVLKPLLTIEGKTRQQLSIHLPIAAALIAAPFYIAYVTIPAVRDFVSLSSTVTVNRTNGYRISYPDRSYFVTDRERRGWQANGRTYITYAGYTEGTFQKMGGSQCQLVPRGEKIRLGSVDPPTNAEGFKAKVGYFVRRKIEDLTAADYMTEWLKHPDLWLDPRKLGRVVVDVPKESSWEEFAGDWDDIREDADDYRSFEVRALAREHAVICF